MPVPGESTLEEIKNHVSTAYQLRNADFGMRIERKNILVLKSEIRNPQSVRRRRY